VGNIIKFQSSNYVCLYLHVQLIGRASFFNTSKWIEDIRAERGDDVIIVMVGNKTDLSDLRQVSVQEGEDKAAQDGVMFIESSAKLGLNIKQLFRKLAIALPIVDGPSSREGSVAGSVIDVKLKKQASKVKLSNKPKGVLSGCC
jgi:Ras-related protein Rab-6A